MAAYFASSSGVWCGRYVFCRDEKIFIRLLYNSITLGTSLVQETGELGCRIDEWRKDDATAKDAMLLGVIFSIIRKTTRR